MKKLSVNFKVQPYQKERMELIETCDRLIREVSDFTGISERTLRTRSKLPCSKRVRIPVWNRTRRIGYSIEYLIV